MAKATGGSARLVSLGSLIRRIRQKRGVSLRRLARAAGMYAPKLCLIEHGKQARLQYMDVDAIARALGGKVVLLLPRQGGVR